MNASSAINTQISIKKPSFDIHEKLKMNIKNGGENYSYLKATQPHQGDAKVELITIHHPEVKFLLYERTGNYFVLIDFFKSYAEACEEAKKIIDSHDLKPSIDGWISYQADAEKIEH